MDRDTQKALSDRILDLAARLKQTLDEAAASKIVEDLEAVRADLDMLATDFAALAEDVRTALGDPAAEIPDATEPRRVSQPPPAPEA